MKITVYITLLLILITTCIAFMLSYPSYGTRPNRQDQAIFARSPNFNGTTHQFVNRRPELIGELKKRITFSVYMNGLFARNERVPLKRLPEVKPNFDEFLRKSNHVKVIWFGHSTLLLNFSGKTILIDPMFSGHASSWSFLMKRFQNPVVELEELPPIDYIVISHDHFDHLDMETVRFFRGKKTGFIVPLGVGSHLAGWGIDRKHITELDWWQEASADGLVFAATPAQHTSGRDGIHDDETLWASWVIKDSEHRIYFSGDTGYDIHFQEIGNRYGPFEMAFVETGQYNELWPEVHMLPAQSVQAFFDLKAKQYFPVHWGMFNLAFHTWYEPIVNLSNAATAKGIHLLSPMLGELVDVDGQDKNELWWKTACSDNCVAGPWNEGARP